MFWCIRAPIFQFLAQLLDWDGFLGTRGMEHVGVQVIDELGPEPAEFDDVDEPRHQRRAVGRSSSWRS